MENNHPLISRLTKASGALLTISVFTNLITLLPVLALALRSCRKKIALTFYIMNYIDALFMLGPEVMWTYMFLNVTTAPENSTGMGPGITLLWIAFVAKISADLRVVKFAMKGGFCGKRLGEGCRPRRRSNVERSIGQCLEDCECGIARGSFAILDDCLRW